MAGCAGYGVGRENENFVVVENGGSVAADSGWDENPPASAP